MPNELPAADRVVADPAVRTRGVGHRYGAGPKVLEGVDLMVERGGVTALIGANGSGKTTLLRILAGILKPTAGRLEWPGLVGESGSRDLRRLRGYLSQDPALDPEMTCGETLTLLASLHGIGAGERARRLGDVASRFGLAESLVQRVDRLSGGQRRRLHLAAGMLHDPALLCLDEPAVGLDPDGVSALWAELGRRAEQGAAVVVVTHDLAAVERFATAVVVLERGAVVAAGPPRDLVVEHPPDLAAVYRQATGREPTALAPKHRGGRRRRP